MIVFVDQYSDENVILKRTLQKIERECEVLCFQEAYGDEETISVSELFVRGTEETPYQIKELHNAFLDIPPYWHVMVEGVLGAIYDMDKKKATIYFREPKNKRVVERVEWLTDSGYVCKIDYYNQYGFVGCRVLKNNSGEEMIKTYYSSKGEEVISHDLHTDIITLFEDGQVKEIFDSLRSFEKNVYAHYISVGESIVLTSQRQVEIFRECEGSSEARVCVLLNDAGEIQKYQNMGEKPYPLFIMNNTRTVSCGDIIGENVFRLCYGTGSSKKVNSRGDALILTMSDRIVGIERLVDAFPKIKFHIGANTQVSNKLLDLGKKANVEIYPQISKEKRMELFQTASYYLDINHAGEIYDAIIHASMNDLVILGFEDTLHDKYYVLDECTCAQNDCDAIIAKLHSLVGNDSAYENVLKKQKRLVGDSLTVLASKMR